MAIVRDEHATRLSSAERVPYLSNPIMRESFCQHSDEARKKCMRPSAFARGWSTSLVKDTASQLPVI